MRIELFFVENISNITHKKRMKEHRVVLGEKQIIFISFSFVSEEREKQKNQ